MANTTDKSILTAAGKALLAQLNAEEKALVIDKMIFANVPNRAEFPQPDDVVPNDHIVHQEGVEQRGRLSADSVIYSCTLTSDVGPFDFNWTGAYCSEYGVLVTVDHHALTPKTADEPGVAGNTLVRSVVLEYKDIAEITNITVDAASWQYNATPRMQKMDDDVAQAIIDQNGKDWFIEDGFLVTPSGDAYSIKAGAGYVSGNRVTLEFDRSVSVPNKPSFIYVDARREGTPTGEQVMLFDFVVTSDEKDDYTDGDGVKHFVCKVAQVLGDGSVSDLRPESGQLAQAKVMDIRVQQQLANAEIWPADPNVVATEGDIVAYQVTAVRTSSGLNATDKPIPPGSEITTINIDGNTLTAGGIQYKLGGELDLSRVKTKDTPTARKLHERFEDSVNIRDFESLVIKTDPGDKLTWDWGPALKAAIEFAWNKGTNDTLPGSAVYVHATKSIYLPHDIYCIKSLIDIDGIKSINIFGDDRSALVGDGSGLQVAFKGNALRFVTISNIWIQNFVKFAEFSTSNLDGARWTFNSIYVDAIECFMDSVSYALSRSTQVTFNESIFFSACKKIGDFYTDSLNFNECWFQNPQTGKEYIKANSNTNFDGCMRIPVGASQFGSAFLLFTNDNGEGGTVNEYTRNVNFRGLRNSNEGGNSPLVVADMPIQENQGGGTPVINLDGCYLNGYMPGHYEDGGNESGLIMIKQYPAAINLKSCSMQGIGDEKSRIVAKLNATSSDAPDQFRIDMDESTYKLSKRVASVNSSTMIADSLIGYLNNPDPELFRNTLDDGNLRVQSIDNGQVHAQATLRTGWSDPDYPAPVSFILNLSGFGSKTINDLGYSGTSVYIVTVSGFYSSGHKAKIAVTKLHGDDYGFNNESNCDIISAHFGNLSTGSAVANRAVEYDISIVFGTNVVSGMARIMPLWEIGRRQKYLPQL
ncbi:phage tail-collar fiber domain-containing protein [Vibrio parahaemolyticus]|uniref:phage tail-collar fiber domain-containing protein n=1 Tax=Vibrio parahaemolyticus TaxID=670 RepID=UPI000A4A406E|nr:phage tail protein [Vibrio parahaemolyticus]